MSLNGALSFALLPSLADRHPRAAIQYIGAPSSGTTPTISFDPLDGSEVDIDDEPTVSIDGAILGSVVIWAEFPGIAPRLIFAAGGFLALFGSSDVVSDGNDHVFTIIAGGGWPQAPTIKATAVGTGGALASDAAAYTLPAVPVPASLPEIPSSDPASLTDLRMAILVSLFSNAKAPPSVEIPSGLRDRQGWFADQFAENAGDAVGSLLWLLDRSDAPANVLARSRAYAEQCLGWMISDGLARAVEVDAFLGDKTSGLDVGIVRPNGDRVSFRFADLWDAELLEKSALFVIT